MVNRSQSSNMALIKDKRGIFFTALVILIITLFVLSFTFYSQINERKSTQKRIETMNSFLFSIEKDMPRQIYISGFRIIFLIEGRIAETGNYVPDVNAIIQESFFNGTLYGQPQDLMIGVTFKEIELKIREKANKINTNITLSKPILEIEQEDPWNVKLTLTTKFLMEDLNGLALWNKTEVTIAYIPIENFEDPLYLVTTNGAFSNKLSKANDLVDYFNLDSSSTKYINNTDAPSFINRLQGSNEADENGIESLINLVRLSNAGVDAKEGVSIVDHLYFSPNTPAGCHVQGRESWFLLDAEHLNTYGFSC